MKKILSVLLVAVMALMLFSGCELDNGSLDNTTEEMETTIPTETTDPEAGFMDDGIINNTNAKDIEDALKANVEYNFPDDHSLVQSQINGEWHVSSSNNTYNTYTKSYDLYAYDTLEVEIASFATYDDDIDFLLYCVSFFETSRIDIAEVQQWITDYNPEDGYVTKIFGDAEFHLHYGADNDPTKFELTIMALE